MTVSDFFRGRQKTSSLLHVTATHLLLLLLPACTDLISVSMRQNINYFLQQKNRNGTIFFLTVLPILPEV